MLKLVVQETVRIRLEADGKSINVESQDGGTGGRVIRYSLDCWEKIIPLSLHVCYMTQAKIYI